MRFVAASVLASGAVPDPPPASRFGRKPFRRVHPGDGQIRQASSDSPIYLASNGWNPGIRPSADTAIRRQVAIALPKPRLDSRIAFSSPAGRGNRSGFELRTRQPKPRADRSLRLAPGAASNRAGGRAVSERPNGRQVRRIHRQVKVLAGRLAGRSPRGSSGRGPAGVAARLRRTGERGEDLQSCTPGQPERSKHRRNVRRMASGRDGSPDQRRKVGRSSRRKRPLSAQTDDRVQPGADHRRRPVAGGALWRFSPARSCREWRDRSASRPGRVDRDRRPRRVIALHAAKRTSSDARARRAVQGSGDVPLSNPRTGSRGRSTSAWGQGWRPRGASRPSMRNRRGSQGPVRSQGRPGGADPRRQPGR